VKNNHDSGPAGVAAEETSPLPLELLKTTKKRCKGIARNGSACTAWGMEDHS
jgi:hypothetical protein